MILIFIFICFKSLRHVKRKDIEYFSTYNISIYHIAESYFILIVYFQTLKNIEIYF